MHISTKTKPVKSTFASSTSNNIENQCLLMVATLANHCMTNVHKSRTMHEISLKKFTTAAAAIQHRTKPTSIKTKVVKYIVS